MKLTSLSGFFVSLFSTVVAAPCFALSYPDFSSTERLALTGSAVQTGNVVQLTSPGTDQLGAVWYATKQSIGDSFYTSFTFRISNPDPFFAGGDGLSFCIQDQGPDAIGSEYGTATNGFFGVSFNTFYNPGEPSDNFVGVVTNSAPTGVASWTTMVDLNPTPIRMKDGNVHTAVIYYNNNKLNVSLDSIPILSDYAISLAPGLDAEKFGWVGFGARTGAAFENTEVLSWTLLKDAPPTPSGIAGNYQCMLGALLQFRLTARRGFSGTLQTAAERLRFSGTLVTLPTGECRATATLKSKTGQTHHLGLLLPASSDQFLANLDDSDFTPALKATYSARNPSAQLLGRYTVAGLTEDSGEEKPGGHNYMTVSVNASGAFKIIGRLGDGTTISQGGSIVGLKKALLFTPLYGKHGLASAVLDFDLSQNDQEAVTNVGGELYYSRFAEGRSSNPYSKPFEYDAALTGARYVPPEANQHALATSSVVLRLSGFGGTFSSTNQLTLNKNDAGAQETPDRCSLVINRSTGVFSGRMKPPGASEPLPVAGCIIQRENKGYGQFKMGQLVGGALIEPSE